MPCKIQMMKFKEKLDVLGGKVRFMKGTCEPVKSDKFQKGPSIAVNTDVTGFKTLRGFCPDLLDVAASDLVNHLAGPTLFHIEGQRKDPLFISTLLHGNETTGWQAIQRLMKNYQSKPLPRSLMIFIGNIEAAKANVRTLAHQHDYNRAWPGTPDPETPEARMMAALYEALSKSSLFASIDIHNNTGHNPLYACVNKLNDEDLHLARLFARTVVYFTRPRGVQSLAMTRLCPAVTIECGRVGQKRTVSNTFEFIEAALKLSSFPSHPLPDEDIDILKTHAIVKVPGGASLSFDGSEADFCFRPDLDHLNFSELNSGTPLGALGGEKRARLEILPAEWGEHDLDLIDYQSGAITLKRPAIPAMLTLEEPAIRADCLGYLMHRIDRANPPPIETAPETAGNTNR